MRGVSLRKARKHPFQEFVFESDAEGVKKKKGRDQPASSGEKKGSLKEG